jgi:hypothetical protein
MAKPFSINYYTQQISSIHFFTVKYCQLLVHYLQWLGWEVTQQAQMLLGLKVFDKV